MVSSFQVAKRSEPSSPRPARGDSTWRKLRMRARETLRQYKLARDLHRLLMSLLRRRYVSLSEQLTQQLPFDALSPPAAISLAYQVMLRRQPDAQGYRDKLSRFENGTLTWTGMLDEIRGSEEYQQLSFGAGSLHSSIHFGRQQFIRALPKALHIIDLGGTHLFNDDGALVGLGYPYDFEELTIIDLPSTDRHQLYQSERRPTRVHTRRGPVTYRYHSMTDLGDFGDGTTDLVYAGQSIEHVPPEAGAHIAKEVFRVLRPGGCFAIDTPNGRVTRIQQADFIDPDHKVEYTYNQIRELLEISGFTIVFAKGLNYGGPGIASGSFDPAILAANAGLYDEIEDSYILCLIARKPKTSEFGDV